METTPSIIEDEEPPSQAQTIPVTSETDSETTCSASSTSTSPEEEYRRHTSDMIEKHGLELTKAWFNLECMKCKKHKVEKK